MNKRILRMLSLIMALVMLLLTMPFAMAAPEDWAEPCTNAPYYREYEDENMWITIEKIEEGSDLTYYVLDVQLRDVSHFKAALSSDRVNGRKEELSEMAARKEAVMAINADQYGSHKFGVIIRNGELIRAKKTTRHMLIVEENGDLTIDADRKHDDFKKDAQALLDRNVIHTFEFGPELIRDGQMMEFSSDFDVIPTRASHREPRTAIGQLGPLHYIIIVVEGRGDSKGASLQKLRSIFLNYDVDRAINLDGGGSTELWFMGEIINALPDDHERSLTDMIYFK